MSPTRSPSRTGHHRVTVVGGGMAGVRLAEQLAGDPRYEVTVLGEERHPPYNRVLLAEVLAARYAPQTAALPALPAGVLRPGMRAVRIDREHRAVHCADGTAVRYDTLVLATGSSPVLPPLRGLAGPPGRLPHGVHPFRTMDDCLALAAAAAPGSRAVVVGGGLLGVSAARALASRGADVALAQLGDRLMDRHLDAPAAALLRTRLAEFGVRTHLGRPVRGVLTGPDRAVTAVELADGRRLAADLVVLACGVRPRADLARSAGLAVARGIVVDDRLRTRDPRIHAIGDCAEHNGTLYGQAGAARDQADVLARVIGGAPAAYRGTRALTRLTLSADTPLDIAAFGTAVPEPGDEVLRLSDATRRTYRKVVLREDRLVGGVLLGDLAAVGTVARSWEDDEPQPFPPLHLLTDDGGSP